MDPFTIGSIQRKTGMRVYSVTTANPMYTIILTNHGDLLSTASPDGTSPTDIVGLNPLCTLPLSLRDREGVVVERTPSRSADTYPISTPSNNGLWNAVVASDGAIAVFYMPWMSKSYGKYSLQNPFQSQQVLTQYCQLVQNKHPACTCSSSPALQDECIRSLGLDPSKLNSTAKSVLRAQCPCFNLNCKAYHQQNGNRNIWSAQLGVVGSNAYAQCPSTVTTTICSIQSTLEDSMISADTNQVVQQCGSGLAGDVGIGDAGGDGNSDGTSGACGMGHCMEDVEDDNDDGTMTTSPSAGDVDGDTSNTVNIIVITVTSILIGLFLIGFLVYYWVASQG